MKLEIYELNNGNVVLFYLDGNRVLYEHTYDDLGEQVSTDVKAYLEGFEPTDWDGNELEEAPNLYAECRRCIEQRNGGAEDITERFIK